jgi:pimeloyl-ACP methyl ester carboxylesterase
VDYRGYGDSVIIFPLNETTFFEDAKAVIKLVNNNVGDEAKLVIYGHSMGTYIASHAVAECMQEDVGRVDGIILDSPFHSFRGLLKLETMTGSVINYVLDFEGTKSFLYLFVLVSHDRFIRIWQ